MSEEVHTVSFTLGENFGKLLTEIALENLHDLNITKALSVFSNSLGCNTEISKELLLGNYILVVSDSEKCECKAIPVESYRGDLYPTINFTFLQNKVLELLVPEFELELVKNRIEYNGFIMISNDEQIGLRYKKLVDSILNNDQDVLDLINTENPGENFEIFAKTVEIFRKIKILVGKREDIIKTTEFIEDNWKFHKEHLREEVEDNINVILEFLIDIANM